MPFQGKFQVSFPNKIRFRQRFPGKEIVNGSQASFGTQGIDGPPWAPGRVCADTWPRP